MAALLCAWAASAGAQESDSTRALSPTEGQPDALRTVLHSSVPAAAPLLSLEPLAADAPHRFLYDLGSTGFPHGVGIYGLRPEHQSLTLDGIPFNDLFTGRPRFDLLPLEVLGALHGEPAFGYTAGTSATLRPLPAPVARTELRYVTGQEGVQQIGATHAQERRPGWVGRSGRLGALAHVSGRDANGYYGSSDTGGFRVLGRVRLLRPAYSVEIVEMQQRETSEARSDVTSFDPSAPVTGVNTSRETVRNDLWATVRGDSLLGGAVAGTAFWTVQRSSFDTGDTAFIQRTARGNRLGARLSYSTTLGHHRLEASVSGWRDGNVEGSAVVDLAASDFAELRLQDTIQFGTLHISAVTSIQHQNGTTRPSGSLAFYWPETGLSAAVQVGHAAVSRLERSGGFGIASGADPQGQTLSAEAALDRSWGPFALRLGSYVLRQHGLVVPAFDPAATGATDSIALFSDRSSLLRMGGEAALQWRAEATRGLYASLTASAQGGSAERALGDRLLRTLPPYWGRADVGWRALGVFGGVLDLDASVGGRYWPAFQSLDFHAPSALFALPAPGTRSVPSSATLDARISARVQRRASVFLLYQNALGARAVGGSYLVPIFPLSPHQLSFGVFWTLLN